MEQRKRVARRPKRELGRTTLALGLITACAALFAVLLAPLSRGDTDPRRAEAVGGDFSLDFVASAPFTYNHATGAAPSTTAPSARATTS